MSGPSTMMRREKAGEKARRVQKKLDLIEYCVENNDVLILSGPYRGKLIREMFLQSAAERDYIVQHLWFQHDDEVVKILKDLCCK